MKKIYLFLFSCLLSLNLAATDFTNGVFFVNEGWFGHGPASVNFLDDNGNWTYKAFQKVNEGYSLGSTCNFATVYDKKIYFVSKQTYSSDNQKGGRLVVADVATLKQIASFDDLQGRDGRSFIGVSPEKGYIGTSNGILTYDIQNNKLGEAIEGLSGEYGTLIASGNYLFALGTREGLRAIELNTDNIAKTWSGIKQIARTKDGKIWCYTTGKLTAIDPATLDEVQTVELPAEIEHNQWAWNAGLLCASSKHNALYWGGKGSGWLGSDNVWKLDLEVASPAPEKIFDLSGTDWKAIYGAALRVDPVSDHIYMQVYKDYGNMDYTVFELDENGTQIGEYPLTEAFCWFPALSVFPEGDTVTGITNATGHTDHATAVVNGRMLSVTGCAGQTLRLYQADGKTVATIRVDSDRFSTQLYLAKGIYLLRGNALKLTFQVQ